MEEKRTVETRVHINYPDGGGRIYCRRLNKVITLDAEGEFWANCQECPMFAGDYQGQGVECSWADVDDGPDYCSSPAREQLRVSKLIDDGVLPQNA